MAAWVAPTISAVSSVLGGLGGGEKRPRYRDALQAQMYATQNDFDVRLKAAKKHGLHPLVALGTQPVTAPQPHIVGDTGRANVLDGLSRAGQDISRAVMAHQTRDERDQTRRMAFLAEEHAGLQNDLLRSQIAAQRGQLPPARGANPTMPDVPTVIPRSIYLRDRDGRLTEVPNPDAGDNEFLMAQDWMTRTLPNDIKAMASRTWDNIRSTFSNARALRDARRSQR